jgi:hypothetical protein
VGGTVGAGAQGGDRGEQLSAMVNRAHAGSGQVLGSEIGKDLSVDVVLAERLLVLFQRQTTQSGRDVHGLLPAPG